MFQIITYKICGQFAAAIADVKSFIQPVTPLFFEVLAGLITGKAKSGFDATDKNLFTDIDLAARISVETEVLCIIERAFVYQSESCLALTSSEMVVGSSHKYLAMSLKV